MEDGVPTILRIEDSPRYGPQHVAYFCTPDFIARCVVKESIYLLTTLNSPARLYYGLPSWQAILVRPTRWQVLPSGQWSQLYSTSYAQILQCFEAHVGSLERPSGGSLPPAHQAYLEMLQDHIALSRQVEQDRARNRPPIVFNEIEATGTERVVRQTCILRLREPSPFAPGEFVWIGLDGMNPEGPRARARVLRADGCTLEVMFEGQVDLTRVPRPGLVGFEFNDVQQRVQEQAVKALRDGTSLNPHLLRVIVDGEFASYPMPENPEEGPLNTSQNRALHCALAVRDFFLILGPPGTGKTQTITEMAKRLAQEDRKTLLTSKNNLAVDNVLTRLEGLRVVRIGHEDRVAPDARHLLIDEQARAMQEEITVTTEEPFRMLEEARSHWGEAANRIARLREAAPLWAQVLAQQEEAWQALRSAQQAVWEQHAPALQQQLAAIRQIHQRAMQAVSRANRAATLLERVLALRGWPLVGAVVVAMSAWLAGQAHRAQRRAEEERVAYQRSARWYEEGIARYEAAIQGSPPVLSAKEHLHRVESTLRSLVAAVRSDLEQIHAILTPSPVPLPDPTIDSPAALSAHLEKLLAVGEVITWRHRLLAEWRELLRERRQALYGTLIRSADVVGATCIGVATSASFHDLEFDTVIADEAGQITVFDLLVPLVRARRAILVGDHRQLPPFVDDEVRALLDEEDEESIAVEEQSLFERLFEGAPDDFKAMLDTQYRMPASIADFISRFFYEGKYHTAPALQTDPALLFFSRPLCFVDTLHREAYRERKGKEEEAGYCNPGEARLLARLVDACLDKGWAIGVIVPYQLQVAEVRRALHRRRSDLSESDLRDIVATVDSFQGKEREIILFGFTRSNNWGGVGFLRELRRLNVTITRARRQLILVGDQRTLVNAADLEFRTFAQALLEYVRERGQYLTVEQAEEVIRANG